MKKSNKIELVGVGTFDIYPIKTEEKQFRVVSKDLRPIKKVLVEKNKQATYKYFDDKGTEYNKEDIGFDVNGKFFQKVERTHKVTKYNIIDKTEIIGDFMSDGYFIIDGDDRTSQMNIEKELGDEKAIEYTYKSSTNGMKWRKAYIFKSLNKKGYVMIMGLGSISEGLEEFETQKEAVEDLEELKEIVVSAKADDIEIDL